MAAHGHGPTLRDVARAAGVAPITASRIINGSRTAAPIAAETRARVERAAADLGYRLDGLARAMRHRRFGQIGIVVVNNRANPRTNLPAYEYILGINDGLEAHGFVSSLVRVDEVAGEDVGRARALSERLVDAFIVVSHLPAATIERLRGMGERLVWLDTDVDAATACVRRDEVAAGREAARMLIAAGRRRVLWIERPQTFRGHYSHDAREAGARAACADAGITFTSFACGPTIFGEDAERLLAEAASPGTGLLVSDPNTTRRIQSILVGAGLAVGRDVGIACCDADHHLDEQWPELSRVSVSRYRLGIAAAGMAVELVESQRAASSLVVAGQPIPGSTA